MRIRDWSSDVCSSDLGYCASMRVDEDIALVPHDWEEITANGFGSRHDPTGAWLYGYEMCVDPRVRGVRIGQRLYDARQTIDDRLELKGIIIGGRMPGSSPHRRTHRQRRGEGKSE